MSPAALMTVALVIADPAAMRAADRLDAPLQATLWRGDWLEVRGTRGDFIKVYDHRRERPGYIHNSLVRTYKLAPRQAPALRAVLEFVGVRRRHESLGIGLAALYMKAAPAGALDAGLLLQMGRLARQLARRASEGPASRATAAHLDVAASYGVRFVSQAAADGDASGTRICYDGAAFRQALALGPSPEQLARAVLALSEQRCAPRGLRPDQQRARHAALLAWLDKADPARVPPQLGNRLRIRHARLAAIHAFELARTGKLEQARQVSRRGRNAWLRVDRTYLTPADRAAYDRAALQVAAARWARATAAPSRARLTLGLRRGEPGQTCMQLLRKGRNKPLLERCTYGVVWPASVQVAPRGGQLAVAVQQLPGWVEQWVFHRAAEGWQLARLAPAVTDPSLGYVEVAGWTPRGTKLLLVREALVEGKLERRFQQLGAADLAVQRESRRPRRLRAFRRWSSAAWKRGTLALR